MDMRSKNPFYRIFEVFGESLKKGTLNIISGPPGIGKTTMLVHLGIYRVLAGYHILHISKSTPDKVHNYYNSVLSEVLKELSPKDVEAYKEMIIQKRTIICFTDHDLSAKDLIRTVSNLRAISIDPCCLLMDDLDIMSTKFRDFIDFLKGSTYELWASSVSMNAEDLNIPVRLEVELIQSGDSIVAKVTERKEGELEKKESEFALICNSLMLK